MNMHSKRFSRRDAFKLGGVAVASGLVSKSRIAKAADVNEQLNVAAIGVGGKGWSDLAEVASAPKVRIVALCDVDSNNLRRASERYSSAKTFADYRKLLDEMHGDVDAVLVATPDHMHAPIALAAMSLGKHAYVEKPLAHNLAEVRRMQEMAAEKNLVTQMGTQVHSHSVYQTAARWLQQGAIGKVKNGYAWVGASWSAPSGGRPQQSDPVPEHLDWDLWLGVAAERPYVSRAYHPENWRRWCDFGTGTLGDMGCHILDPVKMGLDLGVPTAVISRGPAHTEEGYAKDSDIEFTFPGTSATADQFTLRWLDSGRRPPTDDSHLPGDFELPGAGSLLIGEEGAMLTPHWGMPVVYRNQRKVDVGIEPVPSDNHYHQWADACRGEGTASAPFSYSAPLAEAVLTGVVAGRFPDQTLRWNSKRLEFDSGDATQWVKRDYRQGWELPTGA